MPRPPSPLLLALLLPWCGALQAQTDSIAASRAAAARAVRAYQAHDLAGFLDAAEEAQRLRPTHGASLYNLACARALAGDTAGALAALRRFAALGYAADPAGDEDLRALRGLQAFDTVRAALERNAAPLVRSRRAFTLPRRDLLTEGIAYDPASRAFFVGSVHRGAIYRRDRAGRVVEWVRLSRDTRSRRLGAPLGMRVDPARGALWIAMAAVPQLARRAPGDTLASGLVRIDLATGRLTGAFPLPADGAAHGLGDVTVGRDGAVYATDSRTPAVYRVSPGGAALELVTDSPLLVSPQGLALSRDERVLYVADYARGLLQVDLSTGAVGRLGAGAAVQPLGIDGLYRVGTDLIGIQNGVTPHRVVRLRLDPGGDSLTAATVLERAHPDYAEPTLGVVVGRDLFYVANSQWERFAEDGRVTQPDSLRPPVVLRLPLDPPR